MGESNVQWGEEDLASFLLIGMNTGVDTVCHNFFGVFYFFEWNVIYISHLYIYIINPIKVTFKHIETKAAHISKTANNSVGCHQTN